VPVGRTSRCPFPRHSLTVCDGRPACALRSCIVHLFVLVVYLPFASYTAIRIKTRGLSGPYTGSH